MNTSAVANKHEHWVGCMYSTLLASLNDGASIKGALESLPQSEGKEADNLLSREIARLAPSLDRGGFIARLTPLVANHERKVADAVVTGLNRTLTATWRERINCTADPFGLARRPMSNALVITVTTDKLSRDPDQLWCSVSIDLDLPVGRVALQHGPRLPKGILKFGTAKTQSFSATGYEELARQMGECIQQAISAFEPDEFPATDNHRLAASDSRGRHAIAI